MKNKKGFTLVEMLVVIALIGVVIAIAIPSITLVRKRINIRLLNEKKDEILVAAQLYGSDKKFEQDTIMGKLSSGYIARAADVMPKQGKQAPWKITNNYLVDRKELKDAKFDDGVLEFHKRGEHADRKPKLVS